MYVYIWGSWECHDISRFYSTPLDFESAAAYCNTENNAMLWSIKNIEEQNWVMDNIVPAASGTDIWIGLEDTQTEGQSFFRTCQFSPVILKGP